MAGIDQIKVVGRGGANPNNRLWGMRSSEHGSNAMLDGKLSRRDMLKASTALAGVAFAQPLKAGAPEPGAITPALIEAARKEGKLSFYSALELSVAERFGKLFEAKYPGIAVRVERSGAERLFQRIGQEQASRINAVDVANSTDPAHYLDWKRSGWLAPYVPEDMARHLPADQIDPDGTYATFCAWLEVIGYNTSLVKREEAPRSYADLLDPKWRDKLVKAHPAYSGAILTVTYLLVRELGWPYFERLAQQRVLQVQSAADPPKKIQIGERAVMTEGNDYNIALLKEQGQPVEAVNAAEGSPLIIVSCGIFRNAPNPNAARLFQSFMFSAEAQQALVTTFAHRSFHALVKEKPGRASLDTVKLLKADPATVLAQSEEIKARYTRIFGV